MAEYMDERGRGRSRIELRWKTKPRPVSYEGVGWRNPLTIPLQCQLLRLNVVGGNIYRVNMHKTRGDSLNKCKVRLFGGCYGYGLGGVKNVF